MIDYIIKYGDRDVRIKTLHELGFSEYNYILLMLSDEKITVEEQYQNILLTLTELTPEEILEIRDITQINLNEILSQQVLSKKVLTKVYGKTLIDLNEISIGRFIDIEYFLTGDDIHDKLETITALMYIDKDITKSSLEAFKKIIVNKMEIGNALQIVKMFTDFRSNLYKDYEGLFSIVSNDSEDDEEEEDDEDVIVPIGEEEDYDSKVDEDGEDESEVNSWGLMEYVYHLANDDILKVENILEKNIFEVLNYLTWKKEKNDEAVAREKRLNNKY